MVVKFAEDTEWYLGLDGQVPEGVYDMVTVALHEMGHGLGYLGSANHNGNSGFLGFQGIPFIYDHFVEEIGPNLRPRLRQRHPNPGQRSGE